MKVSRRDLSNVAVGAAFAAAFSGSSAANASSRPDSDAAIKVVQAFYSAANKGHWGTVNNLFDEYARGRSNSGYFVYPPADPKADKSAPLEGLAAGYEEIGGYLDGRSELVTFLQKRQNTNAWTWELTENSIFSPERDYVVAFVQPDKMSRFGPKKFVHIFWISTEREEGAVLESRISDFYEVELLKVGLYQ